MAAQYFRSRLHERVECARVQRLRILLVAAHRPRAHQRRLGLAVLDHLDSPAVVVFVLLDPRGPAVVAPQTVFMQGFGCVASVGFGEKRIGHCREGSGSSGAAASLQRENHYFTQARRRKIGRRHAYNQWTRKDALSCEYEKVQFNSTSIYETIH